MVTALRRSPSIAWMGRFRSPSHFIAQTTRDGRTERAVATGCTTFEAKSAPRYAVPLLFMHFNGPVDPHFGDECHVERLKLCKNCGSARLACKTY